MAPIPAHAAMTSRAMTMPRAPRGLFAESTGRWDSRARRRTQGLALGIGGRLPGRLHLDDLRGDHGLAARRRAQRAERVDLARVVHLQPLGELREPAPEELLHERAQARG
jgi:hypothetical protein